MIKFQKIDEPQTLVTVSASPKQFQLVRPQPINIKAQEQNLFSGSQELLRQLPEKGPKIDQKGNIMKHTIVGSVQQFNSERQRRQQINKKAPQIKVQLEVEPTINNSYAKLTEFMSSREIKKTPGKLKSKDYKITQLDEEQVRHEINDIEKRIQQNTLEAEKVNQQIKKKLNKGDQLKMDTFQRAFTNYEQTQEDWEHTALRVNCRIQKKQGQSMNDQIEHFRLKQECKQLLDYITPVEQKYGNNYWKQGLRNPESALKNKYPYKYIDKLELDPNCLIESKPPVIEIIRRPKSCANLYKPYSSFTSRFYLDQKLKENQDIVNKLIPQNTEQIGDLELFGQNVLKQEILSVRAQRDSITSKALKGGNFQKYLKKIPINQEECQDELIIQDYDKKHMIQRGQFGSLKGQF